MKSQLFPFHCPEIVGRQNILMKGIIDDLQSSPLGVIMTWSAVGICTVGFVSPFDPDPGSAVVGCLVVGSVV